MAVVKRQIWGCAVFVQMARLQGLRGSALARQTRALYYELQLRSRKGCSLARLRK